MSSIVCDEFSYPLIIMLLCSVVSVLFKICEHNYILSVLHTNYILIT